MKAGRMVACGGEVNSCLSHQGLGSIGKHYVGECVGGRKIDPLQIQRLPEDRGGRRQTGVEPMTPEVALVT